jgi:hypothetical protein
MKNLYVLIAISIISISSWAQSPEKMSYQAVVRDASNNLVSSSTVGMQISILQGSPTGTASYVETQTSTSNTNGLVSIEIGSGNVVSGDFSSIDWANGPFYIKTETDPNGGTSYTITGTTQLMSVPYALHAKNTDSWTSNADTTYTINNVGIGTSGPQGQFELYDGNTQDTTKFVIRSVHNDPVMIWLGELAASSNGGRGTILINEGGNFSNGWNGFKILSGATFDGATQGIESIVIPNTGNESGSVGIGIDPQRKLHVSDAMRLEPISIAPSNPAEGDMYMDANTHKLMVFDGTVWQACW